MINQGVIRAMIERFAGGTLATISPTGTADATTFLRGDSTWARTYTPSSSFATTSGSAVDITGIPTTAREIRVHLLGVSLSGTDDLLLQFLDNGGAAITAGYNSSGHGLVGAAVGSSTSTAGFVFRVGAAANTSFLTATLMREASGTTWVGSHVGNRGSAGMIGGGSIAVGGNVTGVRLTRTGADTFDAGSFFAEWRS